MNWDWNAMWSVDMYAIFSCNAKLKEQASKADAEDIQKKLAEVGAKVELK